VAEEVWHKLVTLPLFPDLTEDEQTYIIEKVSDFA
jgi:dTDP-4-amino-4,6-dideoxygalactose transaminase